MRAALNRSATSAGTCVFIAQVRPGLPLAPNLWPAVKMTLGASGSAAIAARSSRSQAMVSTPAAASRSRTAGSLKRATPTTRRAGVARLARRASVGPILPATPRIIRSPSTLASSSTSAWLGSVRKSSSASLDAKRSGKAEGSRTVTARSRRRASLAAAHVRRAITDRSGTIASRKVKRGEVQASCSCSLVASPDGRRGDSLLSSSGRGALRRLPFRTGSAGSTDGHQETTIVKLLRPLSAALAAAVVLFVAGCDDNDNPNVPPTSGLTITTLSNRADLISGGSALVEVKMPVPARRATLKVDRDGTDITAAFTHDAERPDLGLVTGLKNGANTITAKSTDGSFVGASSSSPTIRSAGRCCSARRRRRGSARRRCRSPPSATRRRSNASGLSTAATDAQCNIATEYKLFYRTKTPVTVTAGDGGCSFVLPDPTPTIADPTPTTPATRASSRTRRHDAGGLGRRRRPRRRRHRAVHRARRARHDQPRHLRHRRAVRPDQAGMDGDRAAAAMERQGASTATAPRPASRACSSAPSRTGPTTRASRGFMVVDNSLTDSLYNSNRVARRRDDDDDEGAHRRQLRRDQVHDGQRLLGRLDPAEHGGVDLSGPARRHPAELRLPRLDHDRHRGHRLRAAGQRLRHAGVDGADDRPDAGADQRQEDGDQRPPRPDRLPVWNNSFGFNNKPGNYVPTLVVNADDRARSRRSARRATTAACRPRWSTTRSPTRPARAAATPTSPPPIWGTTTGIPAAASKRALSTNDNVGVQYGLKALLAGDDHARRVRHAEREDRRRRRRLERDGGALGRRRRGARPSPTRPASSRAARTSARSRSSTRAATTSRASTTSGAASPSARASTCEAGNHGNQVIWRYGTGLLPATAAQIAAVTPSRSRPWTPGCRAC